MRLVTIGAAVLAIAGTVAQTSEANTAVSVPRFWQRVAHCETDSRWDWGKYAHSTARRPGEGSTFEGGLGFYAGTWTMWRRQVHVRYEHAWQAPPLVQAMVASWGLEHGGYWGCLHDGAVDPDGAPSFASLVRSTAKAPLPRGLRRMIRVLESV
jgi:hypothetical protein